MLSGIKNIFLEQNLPFFLRLFSLLVYGFKWILHPKSTISI